MKKVITYGTYDLFHRGHYNLLKRAKELGDYLIVGVTTDNFDLERGKMNTCNNVMERIEAVKATGRLCTNGSHFSKVSKNENVKMAEVQELYIDGVNLFKI